MIYALVLERGKEKRLSEGILDAVQLQKVLERLMKSLPANDTFQSCPTSHGLLTIPAALGYWLEAACGNMALGQKCWWIQSITSGTLVSTL